MLKLWEPKLIFRQNGDVVWVPVLNPLKGCRQHGFVLGGETSARAVARWQLRHFLLAGLPGILIGSALGPAITLGAYPWVLGLVVLVLPLHGLEQALIRRVPAGLERVTLSRSETFRIVQWRKILIYVGLLLMALAGLAWLAYSSRSAAAAERRARCLKSWGAYDADAGLCHYQGEQHGSAWCRERGLGEARRRDDGKYECAPSGALPPTSFQPTETK